MNTTDKEYKGFEIIYVKDIPDCSSKAIYLKHKKTGLEIFHLLNDDHENLCAFNFRTPPESSNGIAHILEHSVLCGSEKYPLRDPFIHLEKQSLNTYLNALTACDKTMYPISSVVEKDFFNLMSVYADSVFFPSLKEEVFMQEGHHLEKDSNGNYSIQGVVYNEMKGCYSNFSQVAIEVLDSSILPGTIYAKDSGGNPSEIPDLTYEKYLETHRRFYRPDNCLVFLYGNIPTEKLLDFLQKDLLDRVEQRLDRYPPQNQTPLQVIQNTKAENFDSIKIVESFVPNLKEQNKDENPSVLVSWRLFENIDLEQYIVTGLLSEILTQHDASPITKALLESSLGSEISNLCGVEASSKYAFMTFGLDGVKRKNVNKVYDVIIKTINELIENGINEDDIECALMEFEIANKEVIRHSGPFSLVLLRRVLRGWTYGQSPESHLLMRSAFNNIKEKIKKDKSYFTSLLKKYFIDNKQCCITVLTPSPKFSKMCREKENLQIERLRKTISDETIEEQTNKLRLFQEKDESELVNCLPHLDARNIKYEIPQIKTDVSLLEYKEGCHVPLVLNIEKTNGISYLNICFPMDVLSAEEYQYIPLLSYMLTEMGWGGLSWDKCSTIVNKNSGSFFSAILSDSCSKTERGKKIFEEYSKYNIPGRDWFNVKIKMLAEKTEACLDFAAGCISSPDFTDIKRIKNLFDEYLSDFENSISSSGSSYMICRTNSTLTRSKAVEELNYGISSLYFLRQLKGKEKIIASRMQEISSKIFSSGAVISLICDEESKLSSVEHIKKFASRLELKIPLPVNPDCSYENLVKLTKVGKTPSDFEFFQKDLQVGYGGCAFECSTYTTLEASAESVYCHWLSTTLLWQRIRTICGAYGASASADSIDCIANIMTYRDPNPYKSMDEIEECLRLGAETEFTEEEVSKAVTGRFSQEIKPRTPKAWGTVGFERFLYCIDQEDVNLRISLTLKVTPDDMHKAAVRLYENFKKSCRKSVLSPKSCKISGKIAKIDL